MKPLRIAIVHDCLVRYGGAERVLEQLLQIYPQAEVFSVVDFLPEDQRAFLLNRSVRTTFLQKFPFARRMYRQLLPLMPLAVEQLDLSSYELVISSSYAVAKGVLTGPDQLHISYVHTPVRVAWDLQHPYFEAAGLVRGWKSWIARWILHRIRLWDVCSAHGVDHFVTNSRFVARRIWKTYRRESTVISPPVDVALMTLHTPKEDFYLTVSRLVPSKRVGVLVEAFRGMPERKLIVIGEGPELSKLRKRAPENVVLPGHQTAADLRDYLQKARAFLFAAEEDFGIAPLEAQACGTPVIALGKGGVLETIRGLDAPRPTGVFFSEPSVQSVVEAVGRFERESHRIHSEDCRSNALRFAPERFRSEFSELVCKQWDFFQSARRTGRTGAP